VELWKKITLLGFIGGLFKMQVLEEWSWRCWILFICLFIFFRFKKSVSVSAFAET
jgi:hypothetical protein